MSDSDPGIEEQRSRHEIGCKPLKKKKKKKPKPNKKKAGRDTPSECSDDGRPAPKRRKGKKKAPARKKAKRCARKPRRIEFCYPTVFPDVENELLLRVEALERGTGPPAPPGLEAAAVARPPPPPAPPCTRTVLETLFGNIKFRR